jgi:hypothetical protein
MASRSKTSSRSIDPLHRHYLLTPPSPLFHYTSLDVLEKITEKGRIWATDIEFLNDKTEYHNAKQFIEQFIENRLSDETAETVAEHLHRLDDPIEDEDIFVTSFSKDGDSLPQWRGYGANGLGVAIGFLPEALIAGELRVTHPVYKDQPEEAPTSLFLMKCVYTDREKKKLVDDGIDTYLSAVEGKHPRIHRMTSARHLAALIDQCSPLFKDESFKEEREWRLVAYCSTSVVPDRHFIARRSMIVPYIEVDLKEKYPSNYITQICIGPTAEPDIACKAVKKLLEYRGLQKVLVKNSMVPYRTW